MSQETVNLFREALDAFNRRDRATWLGLCDPEYENVPPRDWPESASIRGREAIWDFFVSNMEPWEQGSFAFGELIDAGGERVVAEQRAEMRGRASGANVAWCYWHVITFRGGKAVRSEWFTTRAEALAAVGVRE
jgi:ketosteroid isomerase-like protein